MQGADIAPCFLYSESHRPAQIVDKFLPELYNHIKRNMADGLLF